MIWCLFFESLRLPWLLDTFLLQNATFITLVKAISYILDTCYGTHNFLIFAISLRCSFTFILPPLLTSSSMSQPGQLLFSKFIFISSTDDVQPEMDAHSILDVNFFIILHVMFKLLHLMEPGTYEVDVSQSILMSSASLGAQGALHWVHIVHFTGCTGCTPLGAQGSQTVHYHTGDDVLLTSALFTPLVPKLWVARLFFMGRDINRGNVQKCKFARVGKPSLGRL